MDKLKVIPGHGLSCVIYPSSTSDHSESKFANNIIERTELVDSESYHKLSSSKLELLSLFILGILKVFIGNQKWMRRNSIQISDKVEEKLKKEEELGNTVVMCAVNGVLIAIICISDVIKPEALLTIYSLRRMGFNVLLMTGDNRRTATNVAKLIGIRKVFAVVLPSQKVQLIEKMQKKGLKVAMIGDGVNDSPALVQADVGIAIAKSSEITIDSVNIILLRNNLLDVVRCFHLSKWTQQRVRLNFLFATCYNIIAIPVAAGVLEVYMQPWIASAVMALSSVSVIVSSLMIKLYKKPSKRKLMTAGFRRFRENLEQRAEKLSLQIGIDDI